MSCLLDPAFPTTRGCYSLRELRILATSLGYDGDLFNRAMKKLDRRGNLITDREIVSWLNLRILAKDLHRIFNNHTYEYNALVIKSALRHLKQRTLSFSVISSARAAFENEAGEATVLGLQANKESVLRVLRVIDRVSAPLRIQHVLQGMARRLQTSGCLKLFEFFDVVATTRRMQPAMDKMKREEDSRMVVHSSTELCSDFDLMLETPYQRLLKKLDLEYRRSLIKPRRHTTVEKISSSRPESPQKLPRTASCHVLRHHRQDCTIMPHIEKSTSLIQLARNGYTTMTPAQSVTVLERAYKSRPQISCLTPLSMYSSGTESPLV